jgi:hypothetical protein
LSGVLFAGLRELRTRCPSVDKYGPVIALAESAALVNDHAAKTGGNRATKNRNTSR